MAEVRWNFSSRLGRILNRDTECVLVFYFLSCPGSLIQRRKPCPQQRLFGSSCILAGRKIRGNLETYRPLDEELSLSVTEYMGYRIP
ncbi:hypothetical protein BDV19DRAFT_366103 [Aspergillus venezuelensis]